MMCEKCKNDSVVLKLVQSHSLPGLISRFVKDGNFHKHSLITTFEIWECDNGHTTRIFTREKCPHLECKFNDEYSTKDNF